MLTEEQFPTDIVEAAYKVFPKPPDLTGLYGIDISKYNRNAYMRGMLNERLSSQTKIAKEAFEAAREYNSQDGIIDINMINLNDDCSDLSPLYLNFENWLECLIK